MEGIGALLPVQWRQNHPHDRSLADRLDEVLVYQVCAIQNGSFLETVYVYPMNTEH